MNPQIDLAQWLEQLGLSKYLDVFQENDIDIEVLPELTESDFAELGVSLGHRKKILKALKLLQTETSPAPVEAPRPATNPAPAETTPPGQQIKDAERRYLTLMFCDLADSTRLANHIDIEDMHEINRAFQETCTLAINKIDGFVARYMGDGILAYFGYPAAHENDAERAIIAGLEITKGIRKLSERYTLPDDMMLSVRVGIATGPVVVEVIGSGASQESAVVGEAPNLAARLQGFAAPNSIVIEPSTQKLLQGRYELESLGAHPMKGFTEPIEIWQVLGEQNVDGREKAVESKFAVPMVGRDEEMNLLASRWQRVKSGEGQVVLLSGEAGIGKSRITQSLMDNVKPEALARIRFFCSPFHTQTALHPFLFQMQKEAGISDHDQPIEKQKKLEKVILDAYGFSREIFAIIASLISLELDDSYTAENRDAVSQLNLLQTALVEFLTSRASIGPVLLVIEDAHWADPTSLNLLDTLINEARDCQLYILVNSRPEASFSYNESHVTRLSLNKLSEKDVGKMIRGIAQSNGLPENVIASINQKSDGIPLFIEEVTKMLVDNTSDEVQTSVNTDIRVPDSLQASLLSRLDRLGEVKALTQTASVVGVSFDSGILSHLLEIEQNALEQQIAILVENDIIHQQRNPGVQSYRFKHALLREAAYESLLRRNRNQIHVNVANYLRDRTENKTGTDDSLIAYHFSRAGDDINAFEHWLNAGLHAMESGATLEAVGLLDNAKACKIPTSDSAAYLETQYELELTHGRAMNASYGAASRPALEAFRKAVEIAKSLNNIDKQINALDYEFGIMFNAGNIEESLQPAEAMLAIGTENDDLVGKISGYQVLGMAYYSLGDFEQARFALESALDTKGQEVTGINSYPSMTLDYLSYVLFIMGEPERARETCEAAIMSARQESEYSTASALSNSSYTQYMLGNMELVRSYAEELAEIAERNGQYMYHNRSQVFSNLVKASVDHERESLEFLENAVNKLLQSKEEIDITLLLGAVADIQINFQDYGSARQTLETGIEIATRNKEHFYLAELFRLKALLEISELRQDWQSAAQKNIDRAKDIATQQKATGWLKKIKNTENLIHAS